jgi:peptidoglycan/LPS O-acetylase OafA/YrhL
MKKQYEALNGLRGVAALAVVWLHICDICRLPDRPSNAHLAVDFFFCLSGFVVAYSYEDRLKSTMGFMTFLRIRLIRLMPLCVSGAVLGGAVLLVRSLTIHDVTISSVLAATAMNAVLIPSSSVLPLHDTAFVTDGPLWSLCWEMLINIAFGLLALSLTTPRLLAFIAASGTLTVWMVLTHAGLNFGFGTHDLGLGAVRVIFPFAAGVLLCRFSTLANTLALGVGAVLAALLLGPWLTPLGEAAAVLVIFPAMIWVAAGSKVTPGIGAACSWLGGMSYPIYLLNFPIARMVANGAPKLHLTSPLAMGATSLALTLSASWLALKLYDEPLRAWLERYSGKPLLARYSA